ncbi:MAG: hypothetical protein IPP67_03365 [Rhodospirillaceae bacterium]|nr:hypothetical protein [Rhodospirillaceae bacterium]
MAAKQLKKSKNELNSPAVRPVNWRIKADMPTLFANQVLLVRNKYEMHLIFGQSVLGVNTPISGQTENEEQPLEAISIAKIFLSPEIMRQTLKLLNEQMKLHDEEEKKHGSK